MIAVDLWAEHPTLNERHDHTGNLAAFHANVRGLEERLVVHRMLTTEAASLVPDESLDFVFIDATHTYEAVQADIRAWALKVRPGGLIAGHDYHPFWDLGGVVRCVRESFREFSLDDAGCWYGWRADLQDGVVRRSSSLQQTRAQRNPRVAIYSLTRDRLELTRRCFGNLREHAGCTFSHYVLDNGSRDGTVAWLQENRGAFAHLVLEPENLGIAPACNRLLGLIADDAERDGPWDLVIKVDNDCELVTPDLLPRLLELLSNDPEWRTRRVISPRVEGLIHQPVRNRYENLGGRRIAVTGMVGGIFLPVPGALLGSFRYPEELPPGVGDDMHLCGWLRERGATIGYAEQLVVRHCLTTVGQWNAERRYFCRKDDEARGTRATGLANVAEATARTSALSVREVEGPADALPVTVVVPCSASRRSFFEEEVLPSVLRARPTRVVIVQGEGTAPRKRNLGFMRVRTPYVFFCDDDVVLDERCLESLHAALTSPSSREVGYAYCDYEGICVPPGRHPLGERFVHRSLAFDAAALRRHNLASTMSLLRSDLFPGFDEELERLQDWDLWLTLLERGVIGVHVPRVLFQAYYLDAGITSRIDGDEARREVRRRHDLDSEESGADGGMAVSRRTVEVLRELLRAPHRRVVELGTGTARSLMVFATACTRGAEVWSVDDDPRFTSAAAHALCGVSRDRLRANVHLVHAPLQEATWAGRTQRWYAAGALEAIPSGIDLLFVDGPVADVGRFPALSAFLDRLSPRASIVLDDCLRAGEEEILVAWSALLRGRGIEHVVDVFPTDRGLGRIQLLGAVEDDPPLLLPTPRVEVGSPDIEPFLQRLVEVAKERVGSADRVALDLGGRLGPSCAAVLADVLPRGRVLGTRLVNGPIPLDDGAVDLVISARALEGVSGCALSATAREVRRVLRPGGAVVLAESIGRAGTQPRSDARREQELRAAFDWAALDASLVLPDGDDQCAVFATTARTTVATRPWVVDADDFHANNHRLDLLYRIKSAVPSFKITLFTIVGLCPPDFLREVRGLDWVDLVPHGWLHETPLECQAWTYEDGRQYLQRIEPLGLTRGFKAPGWQISDGMYEALLEAGYWVADQRYNDHRRPRGLRAYLLDQPDGTRYAERRHYHVQNVCGNGLEERLEELLALEGEFAFVREVIEPST